VCAVVLSRDMFYPSRNLSKFTSCVALCDLLSESLQRTRGLGNQASKAPSSYVNFLGTVLPRAPPFPLSRSSLLQAYPSERILSGDLTWDCTAYILHHAQIDYPDSTQGYSLNSSLTHFVIRAMNMFIGSVIGFVSRSDRWVARAC
jgi:hypothetical protein